jgi:hypothetical protein
MPQENALCSAVQEWNAQQGAVSVQTLSGAPNFGIVSPALWVFVERELAAFGKIAPRVASWVELTEPAKECSGHDPHGEVQPQKQSVVDHFPRPSPHIPLRLLQTHFGFQFQREVPNNEIFWKEGFFCE